MNRLKSYLPELYEEVVDFVELTNTEEPEILKVLEEIKQLLDNQFVMSADEKIVKRHEKMLNIQADPLAESLDFRKRRVVNRYSTRAPITFRYLKQMLDFLVGNGEVQLIKQFDDYRILIRFVLRDNKLSSFDGVLKTIRKIIPANLMLEHENEKLLTPSELHLQTKYQAVHYPYFMCGTFMCGTRPQDEYSPRKVEIYLQLETENGVHKSVVPLTGLFNAGEGGHRP